MTYFYTLKTHSHPNNTNFLPVPEETLKLWKRYIKKKNWRITQLPNGYYQSEWNDFNENWTGITRRETIEGAEKAIESSIEHYTKKLKLSKGPVVVKTF